MNIDIDKVIRETDFAGYIKEEQQVSAALGDTSGLCVYLDDALFDNAMTAIFDGEYLQSVALAEAEAEAEAAENELYENALECVIEEIEDGLTAARRAEILKCARRGVDEFNKELIAEKSEAVLNDFLIENGPGLAEIFEGFVSLEATREIVNYSTDEDLDEAIDLVASVLFSARDAALQLGDDDAIVKLVYNIVKSNS